MNPITILLADDHAMFRQGLRELLERRGQFRVLAEAANGRDALRLAGEYQPQIAILDIQMPELDGVSVARQIAQTLPAIRVVILTMYREDQRLFEALSAGAAGYLLKDADADELESVLLRVARGETALDGQMTTSLVQEFRRLQQSDDADRFSEREREILRRLVAGQENTVIAAALHLSEKTVANRLSEIFAKLGVSNRTQAARVAVQRGIVDAP